MTFLALLFLALILALCAWALFLAFHALAYAILTPPPGPRRKPAHDPISQQKEQA